MARAAPAAVVVQPAFGGSDGRRYLVGVRSQPTQPALDQPAQVAIE